MYLPIFGAFLEAIGVIVEKKLLKHTRLDHRNYTVFGFLAIVVLMLPLLVFTWRADTAFLHLFPIMLFGFVIIAALVANLCTFYSLKRASIGDFEPLLLMQPLFTIALAVLIYPSERNWIIVSLALVASVSLVLMHAQRHHLNFNRYLVAGVLGSLFFSLELVASKPLLSFFSPFSFYFLRCLFIFIVALALYRPSFRFLDKKLGIGIISVALMWISYRVIIYYGYGAYGVVYTTLLFILAPALMLLFAVIFFKEKISLRQVITNVIIILCIISAIVVQKLY